MGIFDFGGAEPDANGWTTDTYKGSSDDPTSIGARIRAMISPSGDNSPNLAMGKAMGDAAGKIAGAASGQGAKPPMQQQAPAAATPPPVPGKPMIDPQQIAAMGRSPFAAAPGGAPKPAMPKIYQMGQSPFGPA